MGHGAVPGGGPVRRRRDRRRVRGVVHADLVLWFRFRERRAHRRHVETALALVRVRDVAREGVLRRVVRRRRRGVLVPRRGKVRLLHRGQVESLDALPDRAGGDRDVQRVQRHLRGYLAVRDAALDQPVASAGDVLVLCAALFDFVRPRAGAHLLHRAAGRQRVGARAALLHAGVAHRRGAQVLRQERRHARQVREHRVLSVYLERRETIRDY
mmetsp:Transcript_15879/g.66948  ORF Transcript_15879/g.66948 Transcript_15879/m.66948 type:complete len:213 (+) Transcript_15879:733-1371(+)